MADSLSCHTAQLQRLLDGLDTAREQQRVLSAMRQAQSALSAFNAQHQISADSVDEQLQLWAELSDEQRQVDALLSADRLRDDGDGNGVAGATAQEVEAECEQMERELTSTPPSAPVAVQQAAPANDATAAFDSSSQANPMVAEQKMSSRSPSTIATSRPSSVVISPT